MARGSVEERTLPLVTAADVGSTATKDGDGGGGLQGKRGEGGGQRAGRAVASTARVDAGGPKRPRPSAKARPATRNKHYKNSLEEAAVEVTEGGVRGAHEPRRARSRRRRDATPTAPHFATTAATLDRRPRGNAWGVSGGGSRRRRQRHDDRLSPRPPWPFPSPVAFPSPRRTYPPVGRGRRTITVVAALGVSPCQAARWSCLPAEDSRGSGGLGGGGGGGRRQWVAGGGGGNGRRRWRPLGVGGAAAGGGGGRGGRCLVHRPHPPRAAAAFRGDKWWRVRARDCGGRVVAREQGGAALPRGGPTRRKLGDHAVPAFA